MEAASSEINSAKFWDKNSSYREQVVSTVLQTLHCFDSSITPLDVVSAILSSRDKYDQVKHAMLKPPAVSKLFEALASCGAGKQLLRYNLALQTVLNRVDWETRSIVRRLGEEGVRHPILLGHAEIRSEDSATPFLRAIVSQVNTSTKLAQEAAVEKPNAVETQADDDYDFSFDWTEYLDEGPSMSEPTGDDNQENGLVAEAENETPPQEPTKALDEHVKKLIGADDIQQPAVEDAASQANSVASTLVAQTPGSGMTAGDDTTGKSTNPKSKSTREKSQSRSKPRQKKRKIDEVDTQTAESPVFSSPLLPEPGDLPIDPLLSPRKSIRRKGPPKSRPVVDEEEYVVEASTTTSAYQDLARATSVHEEEDTPEYVCDACSKRFKRLRDLADHKNIHTGAKPYKCSVKGCGRRYCSYRSLRNHERPHIAASKDDGAATRSATAGPSNSPSRPRKAKKRAVKTDPASSDAEKSGTASDNEGESGKTPNTSNTSIIKSKQMSKNKSASNRNRRRSRKVESRPTNSGLSAKRGGDKSESEAESDDEGPPSARTKGTSGNRADPSEAAKPEAAVSKSSSSSQDKAAETTDASAVAAVRTSNPKSSDNVKSGVQSTVAVPTLTNRVLPDGSLIMREQQQLLYHFPAALDSPFDSPFGRRVVLELPLSAKTLESIS